MVLSTTAHRNMGFSYFFTLEVILLNYLCRWWGHLAIRYTKSLESAVMKAYSGDGAIKYNKINVKIDSCKCVPLDKVLLIYSPI